MNGLPCGRTAWTMKELRKLMCERYAPVRNQKNEEMHRVSKLGAFLRFSEFVFIYIRELLRVYDF